MRKLPVCAALLLFAALTHKALADSVTFTFAGPGTSGAITLQYGTATDGKYPNQAYELTGISGTFSDSNIGISNASVLGLVPINYATPAPGNTAAPDDFSKFAVKTGLPAQDGGNLTFDNLFWPGESPQTGSDYPFFGGVFDVYGLLFNIAGGDVVNLWSNGVLPGTTASDYGLAVANSQTSLDYIGGSVTPTPEPGTLPLLGTGFVTLVCSRFHLRRKRA